jgi:uncharacterized protein YkwD/LysM repeat protein
VALDRVKWVVCVCIALIACTPARGQNDAQQTPISSPFIPAALQPTSTATATVSPTPTAEQSLLLRINTFRESLGLFPYSVNDALAEAAREQAQWMISTGSITHDHPDGSTVVGRATRAGYGEFCCSEIIFMGGIATEDDAWEFWMNSPVHYRELTSSQHMEVGVGIAGGDEAGRAFVVVFGGYNVLPTGTAAPGTYIVQPGDTLAALAERYNVSTEALALANGLSEESMLFVGQVLTIPQTVLQPTPSAPGISATPSRVPSTTPVPSATVARTPQQHTVQPGETLLVIAQQYGVSVDAIVSANNITNPDRIDVGQVLIIP